MPDILDTCGCCEGVEAATPVSTANRPGLSAIVYRIGTHGRFKQSMQAALSGQPALRDLSTRAADDATVALIDTWAVALDVLSFYQERIANEAYLRTATERRSVLELASRIGYALNPGVAAGTYLAFSLLNAPGAPASSIVAVGTRAQTLPGQDEIPQPFETIEEIEARVDWQSMSALTRRPQEIKFGTRRIYLEGVNNNLGVGDMLLFIGSEREADPGSERWDMRRITNIDLDRDRNLTLVELEYGLGSVRPFVRPAAVPRVYVMRKRAAHFGNNAADWDAMPDEVRNRYLLNTSGTFTDWPGLTITDIADGADTVFLDALYPTIVPESWVVLARPGYAEVYHVDAVAEDARSRFTVSSKSTRLTLEGEGLVERFDDHVRSVVVYGESEELVIADIPVEEPVAGSIVEIAESVEGLAKGQLVAVTGYDLLGEEIAEVATIADVDLSARQITFEQPLANSYVREDGGGLDGVRFNANVARATHGTSILGEVLGSGDGSKVFQKFKLAHSPLTHVSAATPSGAESTLCVKVDGVLWEETPTLYQQPPDARVFVTRAADNGSVSVQFGDGRTGSRLPTGVENVKADYRHRIGLEGMQQAKSEQISLLMTRPFGIKDVVNPTAPTGAADPEVLDDARQNAPLTVLTLDRIVSVQDFEDFTRAFGGVGKAQATLLWNGEQRLVHLTVAGSDGSAVPNDSALYENLLAAIDEARHVDEDVVIASFKPRSFTVQARVLVDSAYIQESVLTAVELAILEAFAFDERAFGQAVTASEVLAVAQSVEGVIAVDLDLLDGRDPFEFPRIPVHIARWSSGQILPAELLTVDADGITITSMTQ